MATKREGEEEGGEGRRPEGASRVAVAGLDAGTKTPTTTCSDGRTSQSTTRGSTALGKAGGRDHVKAAAAQPEAETDAPHVCSPGQPVFSSVLRSSTE